MMMTHADTGGDDLENLLVVHFRPVADGGDLARRALLRLREQEIRRLLDPASCLKAVEEAFTAYATGGASLPAVINLDVEEHKGEIHIKAGHLRHGSHYAVKIASGFQGNPAKGLPQNDGMVLVFDAKTGVP